MSDSNRNGWSWMSDPSKWVPLLLLFGGLISVYVTLTLGQEQNASSITDIRSTISDMKSQLIPKRVQTLEDSFANAQQSNAAQFAAMQSSIQSIQTANGNAQQVLQASLHEISGQMNAQTTTIAVMGQQINSMLAGPVIVGKHR